MRKQISSWEHMKSNNYHWLVYGFIIGGLWMFFDCNDSNVKWIAMIPIAIGSIVIPVANYISWKNKYKNK